MAPYHPEKVYLTDGYSSINYGHFSCLLRHSEDLFSTIAHPDRGIAIDTASRFDAVIWMALCWLKKIPFIPFDVQQPESLEAFKPSAALISNDEGKALCRFLKIPFFFYQDHAYMKKVGNKTQESPGFSLSDMIRSQPDGLFCKLLTSGSTGKPKKVPLLRKNMIAAADNAFMGFNSSMEKADDAGTTTDSYLWGNVLPLQHTGGIAPLFRALLSGTGLFLWNRFDADQIAHDLSARPEIRRISLVPTMLYRILEVYKSKNLSPPLSLEQVLIGGGPASSALLRDGRESGWPLAMSYGMTETCGQIAVQHNNGTSPPDSVGLPFPDHEISIRDEEGNPLDHGISGLLWIRGPQVFPGYEVESEEDKRRGSHSDWFNSHDYAHTDSRGNLYIEARRSDIVLSGGENVSVEEVETHLKRCPGVLDAGVTWLSDPEWGQRVVALIVPEEKRIRDEREASFFRNEIHRHCKIHLKPFQRPREFYFTEPLPRTSLGKIKREELKKRIRDRHVGK